MYVFYVSKKMCNKKRFLQPLLSHLPALVRQCSSADSHVRTPLVHGCDTRCLPTYRL